MRVLHKICVNMGFDRISLLLHILGSIISESSVNSFKLKIDFECLLNTDYCSKYIGVCDFFQKIFFSNVQHITDLLYSRTILSTLHLTQT